MNGVFGHNSGLARLYWAGDNLGSDYSVLLSGIIDSGCNPELGKFNHVRVGESHFGISVCLISINLIIIIIANAHLIVVTDLEKNLYKRILLHIDHVV